MRKTVRRLTTRHQAQGLAADLADLVQNLARGLFDTYRPELHYMRGPGPKWHAKHDLVRTAIDHRAMPALVRIKAR